MTDQLLNIAIGLLTTLVGYVIGRVWQKAIDEVPRRRARIFWGPVLGGELQIVVSRTSVEAFPDPAGLVGGGDALALREISSYLVSVGVKNAEVVYVDEPLLDRTKNLILLGGPDANKLTEEAFENIYPKPGVEVVDPGENLPMEVHDLQSGGPPYVAKPNLDYGVIIRSRNPFNEDNSIVIIAGAYGNGSWGGARLATDVKLLDQFKEIDESVNLANVARSGNSYLPAECIFKVGVYRGRLDVPIVISLRATQSRW